MSQENVEIVRRIYDAVAQREPATVLSLYDSEVELVSFRGTLADHMGQQGVYRGHAGLREFNQALRETFEIVETSCEELIDAGNLVVSVSRYWARGRDSGVEVHGPPQFGLWTIRNGKVVRQMWFSTREEALEAAGLSE